MQRNLKLKYQSHLTNTVLLLSYGPKISNSGLLELRVKALQPFLSTAEVLRENLGIWDKDKTDQRVREDKRGIIRMWKHKVT